MESHRTNNATGKEWSHLNEKAYGDGGSVQVYENGSYSQVPPKAKRNANRR